MSYAIPTTIDNALAIAQSRADFAFVAGGTDLMVQRAQGNNSAVCLIDLSNIAALRSVVISDESVSIGAGTTLASIIRHTELRRRFPSLIEAALSIASPLVRTTATIGGNLLCENRCVYFDQSEFWRTAIGNCLKCGGNVCIATGGTKSCFSVFISDLAPVLICLGSCVEFVDKRGVDVMAIKDLYTGDGAAPHTLSPEAIITRIVIPAPSQGTVFFRKLRPRTSIDFTNLTLAAHVSNGTLTVAATGVGPAPAVAKAHVGIEADELAAMLLTHTQIIDNLSFARLYRKDMLRAMVGDAVEMCGE